MLNRFHRRRSPSHFRQCSCAFRDPSALERFCAFSLHLTHFCVAKIKELERLLTRWRDRNGGEEEDDEGELWSPEEIERVLLFTGKLFMTQFPLYTGPKQVKFCCTNQYFFHLSLGKSSKIFETV